MGFDLMQMIEKIAIFAIPLLFAITIHEAAHGYAARYFGDDTAAKMGRITLNPLKHIDPIGTIVMPIGILLLSAGTFAFGYAKPVPVNFNRLRNPKRDMLWVALAGPASNIVQAFIWAVFLIIAVKSGFAANFIISIGIAGIMVNLVLCMLNLLPIPPLDGGRVLVSLLPYNQARVVAQIEPYGFIIVIVLLVSNLLWKFWISPLVQMGAAVINTLILRPFGLAI